MKSLRKLIADNLIIPESCAEGIVAVFFKVEVNGSVSNPKVLQGFCNKADAEALRVIKLAKFDPAQKGGKPISTNLIYRIKFD